MRKEKPSKTAYKVALNILTLGAIPEMSAVLPAGIVDATAKLLVSSGAAGERTVRWAKSSKSVLVSRAFDWIMPGQFEAFARRKAFFEDQVRKGISAGATQVLVLGAGFDTLSWRLAAEFPWVDFFEIDHPTSSLIKANGIESMGAQPNLHFVAGDLVKRRLVEVLTNEEGWSLDATTIIVAEGFMQYLPPEAVQDLFTQCALISDGGRIAFTYIPSRPNGSPDAGPWTGLVLLLLKLGGEPWLWSIRPEELESFVAVLGWKYSPGLITSSCKQGVEFYAVATH